MDLQIKNNKSSTNMDMQINNTKIDKYCEDKVIYLKRYNSQLYGTHFDLLLPKSQFLSKINNIFPNNEDNKTETIFSNKKVEINNNYTLTKVDDNNYLCAITSLKKDFDF
jgi:regulator of sigma D